MPTREEIKNRIEKRLKFVKENHGKMTDAQMAKSLNMKQREIKVRVWDGKKYHYPEANTNGTNHYLNLGSKGYFSIWDAKGNLITNSDTGGVLELFTGIQDEVEADVYEGDIIRVSYKQRGKPDVLFVYEVVHNNFSFELNHTISFKKGLKWGSLSRIFQLNCETEIEVIGNIHENPELS